jgi:predicted aspartyl protease
MSKVGTLKVEVSHNQITVPGEINGRPIRLLLDTAAPGSLITAPAAQMLGLSVPDETYDVTTHRLPIGKTTVDEFKIGNFLLKNVAMTVRGQRENYGAAQLVAIVGNDFLAQFDIEIDLAQGAVTLFKPQGCGDANMAYWSDSYNMLPLKSKGPVLTMTAQVNGQNVVTVLDSGSPFSTLTTQAAGSLSVATSDADLEELDRTAAASDYFTLAYSVSNGFASERRGANTSSGGELADSAGGALRTWHVKLDSLQLDQETIRPAKLKVSRFSVKPAEIGSRISDQTGYAEGLALGVDFLQSHHILLSRSQNRLYFSYVGAAAPTAGVK